jgi:hypothetical protein
MSRANWKLIFQKPMDYVLKKRKRRLSNKPTESQLEIMVGNGMPNGYYYPFGGV